VIKKLKSSKSLAVDELDSYSLKISADIVGPAIHHLITLSIMQNKFPEPWKYAKVLPLHKKGEVLVRKNQSAFCPCSVRCWKELSLNKCTATSLRTGSFTLI
jgi:hypothetical protein